MPNSYVIKKEQCPECAKLGKDNSSDNLAVYSDGRKYCFSCHYMDFPNKITSFKNKIEEDNNIDYKLPYLPVDCDIIYPQRALDWIYQYELTKEDLYKHNVLWSESLQRLIFPVFSDGHLLAWQGRSFHLDEESQKKYPKWYGRGNLKQTYNLLGDLSSNKIVIVEDVVSAIKVAKAGYITIPMYGSFFSIDRLRRIYKQFKDRDVEVVLWQDPDKRPESFKQAKLGILIGLKMRTVFSDKDPKEHSRDQIVQILQTSSVC